MANGVSTVQFLYRRVIEETIRTSRENFLNEGIEENILQELKTLWESKLAATRVVEPAANPSDYVSRNQVYKYNYGHGGRSVATIIQQQPGVGTQAGYPSMAAYIQHSHLQQQSLLHQQKQQQQQQQQLSTQQPSYGQIAPQRVHQQMASPQVSSGAAPIRPGTNMSRPQAFPILGGVSTVSKSEFQAASGNIQVDGNVDICLEFDIPPQRGRGKRRLIRQLDGATSDEEAGEFVDDDTDESDADSESDKSPDQEIIPDIPNAAPVEEDEPLNSGDDVSDEENTEIEETDNVVVCQYDKVQRSKNKWKLYLKDGVMHIGGKDHVFQKAVGDAEW